MLCYSNIPDATRGELGKEAFQEKSFLYRWRYVEGSYTYVSFDISPL